ncbi:hypothetical protein J2R62_16820, partial [Plesiomonas shigelloides]
EESSHYSLCSQNGCRAKHAAEKWHSLVCKISRNLDVDTIVVCYHGIITHFKNRFAKYTNY